MNIIESLFGRSKTPAERLRQHQRSLEKAQRELDRERTKLESQEKRLIMDIKKAAKNNQMGACRIMAKDLVRTRKHIQKFYSMRTQLQAISLRIQTVRSNDAMVQSMKGATKRIAMEFEKENDIMDQRQEMMDETIDEAMDDEEEESEDIVNQVLDEIGIDLQSSLGEAPNTDLNKEGLNARQIESLSR